MIKSILVSVFVVLSFTPADTSYEQAAVDHFIKTIFRRHYPGFTAMEFKQRTEKEFTGPPVTPVCFMKDTLVYNNITKPRISTDTLTLPISIPDNSIKIVKSKKKSRDLIMRVNREVKVGENHYVEIMINVPGHYATYHYLIELSEQKEILRYCEIDGRK